MNVLLLIDALELGGAETHVITLARQLRVAGHGVCIISEGGALEQQAIESGVRALRFPCPVRGNALPSLYENVRTLCTLQRREHFDVMHAHTRRTALYLRLFRLVCRMRPRVLLRPTAHGTYRKRALRRLSFPSLIVTAHARFVPRFRRLSFWGDATVAVSEDLAQHLIRRFGLSPSAITVIPNGIDSSVFFPDKQRKLRADVFHLVFASRLDEDCSAAAFALLDLAPILAERCAKKGLELRITILGGGACYGALLACAQRVTALGMRQLSISLVGATVSPAAYFRRADVFVGVSRAALEALFCGAAVVLGGNEGFGGLLDEYNFEHFATENFCCRGEQPLTEQRLLRALTPLISLSPDERRARAAAVRRRANEQYSAWTMAKWTLAVYRASVRARCMLHVLIGGYAGCGNLGDDAILRRIAACWQGQAAPRSLISLSPDAPLVHPYARLSLTALTGTGEASPFGIPCIARRGAWRMLARRMREADAFVLGGGALLQNCSAHGSRSLIYYVGLLWLARLYGCPFCLLANGVGPLTGSLAMRAVGAVLRRAAGISVRDSGSGRLLLSLGVVPSRLAYEADPVLSVVPVRADQAARFVQERIAFSSLRPFLCVVPRPCENASCLQSIADALSRLVRERGVIPLLFPFDAQKDAVICRRMARQSGGAVISCEDERMAAGIFARSRGVLSLRLHGLILAKAVGCRAIALPYSPNDPKATDFAAAADFSVLSPYATADDIYGAMCNTFL